jgi:hypothetical protein
MFLQLKAQALKVSDDQIITQAIKALRVGPLHNHLVREWAKTVIELCENFIKFSKSVVLHFRKLEQQRKAPDEISRPTRFSENGPHNNYPKHVNNINSNDCGSSDNWENNFEPAPQKKERAFDHRRDHYIQRGARQAGGEAVIEAHSSICTACIMDSIQITAARIAHYC